MTLDVNMSRCTPLLAQWHAKKIVPTWKLWPKFKNLVTQTKKNMYIWLGGELSLLDFWSLEGICLICNERRDMTFCCAKSVKKKHYQQKERSKVCFGNNESLLPFHRPSFDVAWLITRRTVWMFCSWLTTPSSCPISVKPWAATAHPWHLLSPPPPAATAAVPPTEASRKNPIRKIPQWGQSHAETLHTWWNSSFALSQEQRAWWDIGIT